MYSGTLIDDLLQAVKKAERLFTAPSGKTESAQTESTRAELIQTTVILKEGPSEKCVELATRTDLSSFVTK